MIFAYLARTQGAYFTWREACKLQFSRRAKLCLSFLPTLSLSFHSMARLTTNIEAAVACLRGGGLCAFPTETVYGLGAAAADDEAVRAVFSLKHRPIDHPLIIHVSDFADFADFANSICELAITLAEQFLPGPLTMLLPRIDGKSDLAAANLPAVALRAPAHPFAQALLGELGAALVAPSANLYGRPSPTEANHVLHEFTDVDLLILDGGPCALGIESTIVDLTEPDQPRIARPGDISAAKLTKACGVKFTYGSPLRTSGGTAAHYSPRQPLRVLGNAEFATVVADHPKHTVAALGFTRPAEVAGRLWVELPSDPHLAARELYRNLLALENTAATLIAIEEVPAGDAWLAIADRLRRAAAKNS